jgi:hypothetical protein
VNRQTKQNTQADSRTDCMVYSLSHTSLLAMYKEEPGFAIAIQHSILTGLSVSGSNLVSQLQH